MLESTNCICFGVKELGVCVAYIMVELLAEKMAELVAICTAPSHRRLGLGTALLFRVFSDLTTRGVYTLIISNILHTDDGAVVQWYKKRGFFGDAHYLTIDLSAAKSRSC